MPDRIDSLRNLKGDDLGLPAEGKIINEQIAEYRQSRQAIADLPAADGLATLDGVAAKLPVFSVEGELMPVKSWRDLGAGKPLSPCGDARFYQFRADNSSFDLVVADLKSNLWDLVPAVNKRPRPTSELADKDRATAAVNGGYFIPRDGSSVGYIYEHEQLKEDPRKNRILMHDATAKPYLSRILNRSEMRLLEDKDGKETLDICKHDDPIPAGFKRINSLQAGPQLLPTLTSREEAFIRPDNRKHIKTSHQAEIDSIRSRSPAARTAVGVTADDYVLMLSVAGPRHKRDSRGVTLKQLADVMKELGCVKALNLDGGASTTMYARINPKAGECTMSPGADVNSKHPETWVKSILELRAKKFEK